MHLTLGITNRCTHRCRHCGPESSPEDQNNLSVAEMCGFIDEFTALSQRDQEQFEFSITGGEPFLRFDDMLTVIDYAKQKNATKIGCVTNAFWATSLAAAQQKIALLQEAGLTRMALSCDQFHNEHIGLENVGNAFIAATEAMMQIGFKIVVYEGSPRAYDIIRELGNVLQDSTYIVQEINCLPAGNARNFPPEMFYYREGLPVERCKWIGTFAVLADHEVYPCCVPGYPDLLRLGNVKNESLTAILLRARQNTLFKILRQKGPTYFLPYFERIGISFSAERFISNCHLCQEVLKTVALNDKTKNSFDEAVENWEKEQEQRKNVISIIDDFLAASATSN